MPHRCPAPYKIRDMCGTSAGHVRDILPLAGTFLTFYGHLTVIAFRTTCCNQCIIWTYNFEARIWSFNISEAILTGMTAVIFTIIMVAITSRCVGFKFSSRIQLFAPGCCAVFLFRAFHLTEELDSVLLWVTVFFFILQRWFVSAEGDLTIFDNWLNLSFP